VQEAAIETFAKIGAPAVPHLIRALRIDDDDCIANAAFAIARIGPAAKEALPHLEKRRNRDDSRARNAVLKAIAALG
jgi:HEAT repeat protein